MPTNWDNEESIAYWVALDSETFPQYMNRVARQFSELSNKLIHELTRDNLTKEAADRLVDSLGGPDAGLVSPAVLQDHLVPKQIAKAEGAEDA